MVKSGELGKRKTAPLHDKNDGCVAEILQDKAVERQKNELETARMRT
jgi:hypothetical protein